MMHENGQDWIVSGTSAATPAWAGLMALIISARNRAAQGSANPALYTLANASPAVFRTPVSGDNSVPGVPGYGTNGGQFNMATGLGSVDASALLEFWPVAPPSRHPRATPLPYRPRR